MFTRRILMAFRVASRSSAPRTFATTASRAGTRTSPFSFRSNLQQTPSKYAFSTFQRSRPNARIEWQTTFQRARQRQQKRTYYRRPFNYQRFQSTKGLFIRWAARPTFYYEVGGIAVACGGFYIYNLEAVPVSGRKRFNVISSEYEKQLGQQQYKQTLQEFGNKIMPSYSKEHRMVQRVLDRLLPHSGLQDEEWEIHVINDDMKNAFVIPGGKVFVFRGTLDVCQGDDGLAAVLGHEISHNVAHHAAERMSQAFVLLPVAILGSLLVGVDPGIGNFLSQLVFQLPGSRRQEEEADHIGLLMMAESCYDPRAAMGLWARMEQEEKKMGGGGAPPQFLSTHPSSHNRLEKIRDWLPQAEIKWENGDCAATAMYQRDFKHVAGLPRW